MNWRRAYRFGLLALLPATVLLAGSAWAADPAPAAAPADGPGKSATEINKQLTNPVSDLWSLTFQQNNFVLEYDTPEHGDAWSSNLIFQPVLPIGITEDWNLITRPVVPLFVSQPHPDADDFSRSTRSTAFGDIALLQLVAPTPKLAGNWLLGAGPTWVFPSAGSDFTGSGKWQVGPAALTGYLADKWIAGVLFQNWWSFADQDDRRSTASMNLQPILAYFLRDGWSIGYSGNILANWKANRLEDTWTVPLGVSVGKVVKLGRLPVRLAVAGQYMVVSPDEFGQQWNLQFTVSPVLPKLVKGVLSDPSKMTFGLGR